jgi:hypothetical protein
MPSASVDEAQNSVLALKRQLQEVPVGSNEWYGVQLQLVPATKQLEFLLEEQRVAELVNGFKEEFPLEWDDGDCPLCLEAHSLYATHTPHHDGMLWRPHLR